MLLIHTLECLFSLSSLGEKACNAIVHVSGAVDSLVSLITVEVCAIDPRMVVPVVMVWIDCCLFRGMTFLQMCGCPDRWYLVEECDASPKCTLVRIWHRTILTLTFYLVIGSKLRSESMHSDAGC